MILKTFSPFSFVGATVSGSGWTSSFSSFIIVSEEISAARYQNQRNVNNGYKQ